MPLFKQKPLIYQVDRDEMRGGTNLALNSRVCQESTMYIHQKNEYKAGTSEKEMVFISGPAHLCL